MFYIIDPEGHVYIDGTTNSGDSLARAIRKFAPERGATNSNAEKRRIWEEMKEQGFSVLEKVQV